MTAPADGRPRILFVDDDANLIAAMRNVLHRDRKRWDMTFVLGGAEAIAELERGSFDIVITDMRMPMVSGSDVLEAALRTSPRARRVILSGSDCDAVADQIDALLVKPCGATTVRATIERLLAT